MKSRNALQCAVDVKNACEGVEIVNAEQNKRCVLNSNQNKNILQKTIIKC